MSAPNKTVNTKTRSDVRNKVKFSKSYPAYLLLLALIASSIFIWKTIERSVDIDNKAAFEKAQSSIMQRFEANFKSHKEVLGSMRGLYDYLVQVVRDYFTLYGFVPTKTYNSIICIISVPQVERSAIPGYIHYVRSQGYYDYVLHPPIDRDFHYPAEFIVPDTLNKKMKGFDFASNESFLREIEKAKISGKTIATPVMDIRKGDTIAVYLLSPIYKRGSSFENENARKRNFEGLVVLEMDLPKMLKTALGKGVATDSSVIFECYYTDYRGKEIKVFESSNSSLLKGNYKPVLAANEVMSLYDKQLKIKFYAIPNFGGTAKKYLPILALVTSLALSFIFFAFILSVFTGRARALDLADRITRRQTRILESSNDMIFGLDLEGKCASMNQASKYILGVDPETMIGKPISDYFADERSRNEFAEMLVVREDEYRKRFDVPMLGDNEEVKWLNWDITFSKNESQFYCIGRDITLEKENEERERLKSKEIQLSKQLTTEVSESKSYFLTKLSHQLRNSLTSIIGYHQLLLDKLYDTEEEQESYLSTVTQSSEELFVFVSDLMEVALRDRSSSNVVSVILLTSLRDEIEKSFRRDYGNDSKFETELTFENKNSSILGDESYIFNAFNLIFKALTQSCKNLEVTLNLSENIYESVAEIQIVTSGNPFVYEMISIYRNNIDNLIEILDSDKDDVIINLAIGASMIRMMNGTMSIDSLGSDEGNIVQIALPLNR